MNADRLINIIRRCTELNSIWDLKEKFNQVGLSIERTTGNNIILCRIEKGKPIANKIFEDYISLGSGREMSRQLTDRTIVNITKFIIEHHSKPAEIMPNRLTTSLNGLNGLVGDKKSTIVHDTNDKNLEGQLLKSIKQFFEQR